MIDPPRDVDLSLQESTRPESHRHLILLAEGFYAVIFDCQEKFYVDHKIVGTLTDVPDLMFAEDPSIIDLVSLPR